MGTGKFTTYGQEPANTGWGWGEAAGGSSWRKAPCRAEEVGEEREGQQASSSCPGKRSGDICNDKSLAKIRLKRQAQLWKEEERQCLHSSDRGSSGEQVTASRRKMLEEREIICSVGCYKNVRRPDQVTLLDTERTKTLHGTESGHQSLVLSASWDAVKRDQKSAEKKVSSCRLLKVWIAQNIVHSFWNLWKKSSIFISTLKEPHILRVLKRSHKFNNMKNPLRVGKLIAPRAGLPWI